MSAAFLTLICLIFRYCIKTYVIDKKTPSRNDVRYFIDFLIQAITVVVVSVPEGIILICLNYQLFIIKFNVSLSGLPLAVTLALAYAVRVCR